MELELSTNSETGKRTQGDWEALFPPLYTPCGIPGYTLLLYTPEVYPGIHHSLHTLRYTQVYTTFLTP